MAPPNTDTTTENASYPKQDEPTTAPKSTVDNIHRLFKPAQASSSTIIDPTQTVPEKPKNILVISIDYDGCISCGKFHYPLNASWLPDEEDCNYIYFINTLIDYIRENRPDVVEIIVGSNRQSAFLELTNTHKAINGLAGKTIEFIAKAIAEVLAQENIEVIFNPFLMSDISALKYSGYSKTQFDELLSAITSVDDLHVLDDLTQPNCPYDESKITLLYAQMQQIASRYRDAKINFHFIDDRLDLLDSLHNFFSKAPHTIPPNVVLQFALHIEDKLGEEDDPEELLKLCDPQPILSYSTHMDPITGETDQPPEKPIQGTGEFTSAYAFLIRYIWCICYDFHRGCLDEDKLRTTMLEIHSDLRRYDGKADQAHKIRIANSRVDFTDPYYIELLRWIKSQRENFAIESTAIDQVTSHEEAPSVIAASV